MENAIESLLKNIFSGISLQVNLIFGGLLLAIGILIFLLSRKPLSKKQRIIGWTCIGLGILAALIALIQLL